MTGKRRRRGGQLHRAGMTITPIPDHSSSSSCSSSSSQRQATSAAGAQLVCMAAGPWAERRRGWPAVHERKGGDDYYLELPWYVAGAIARVATRRRRRTSTRCVCTTTLEYRTGT